MQVINSGTCTTYGRRSFQKPAVQCRGILMRPSPCPCAPQKRSKRDLQCCCRSLNTEKCRILRIPCIMPGIGVRPDLRVCQGRLTVKTVMLNLNIFIKWRNTPWNNAAFNNFCCSWRWWHSWGLWALGQQQQQVCHCAQCCSTQATLRNPNLLTPQCWAPKTVLRALRCSAVLVALFKNT